MTTRVLSARSAVIAGITASSSSASVRPRIGPPSMAALAVPRCSPIRTDSRKAKRQLVEISDRQATGPHGRVDRDEQDPNRHGIMDR